MGPFFVRVSVVLWGYPCMVIGLMRCAKPAASTEKTDPPTCSPAREAAISSPITEIKARRKGALQLTHFSFDIELGLV